MKSPLGLQAELPVTDLAREAVQLLWYKRTQVVRMFMPVIALLALIDWLGGLYLDNQRPLLQGILLLASVGLSVLFATACHGFTLLPAEQQQARVLHGWGRLEFRYFIRAMQIGLIAGVVFGVAMFGLMLVLGGQGDSAIAAAMLALLPAVYLWGRLSVTLPELAIGRRTSLKRAWAMSRGNGSRLVLVVIVLPLLLTAPFLLLYWFDHLLLNYLAALGVYASTLISLVMLSLAYRFLLEFYEPAAAVAPAGEEAPGVSPDHHFDA
ncbi:hypothetical protein GJQ54_08880 [Oceanospirillaceae bacterium ASx5O]|nr:hypothetical protein GJQ54_08880 [Oceanospirillaceae bacterium ASx5O]